MHIVENQFVRIEFDAQYGTILRLCSKKFGVELLTEPRLANNFQILLPKAEMQANYICGKTQPLSSFEEKENGVILRWDGPFANPQGTFNVGIGMIVDLVGKEVRFRLNVENRSEFKVTEVWYPILGGLNGVGNRSGTYAMIPYYSWSIGPDIFQNFPSIGSTNLGIPNRECNLMYPGSMPMPWIDIYNPKTKQGVYFACHDPVARSSMLHFELWPGMAPFRKGGNWPRREDFDIEIPIGVLMNWVKFPYTPHGKIFEGPPVVVEFHDGDWHDAASIYRQWFDVHFPLNKSGSWLRREMAWYDNMLLLPEDNINFTFKDIPRLAAENAEYGLRTFLASGWQIGGHDRDYPYYKPDPRLGTEEDLKAAIEECHRQGVRVLFFVNLQPVDWNTRWYREELHKYSVMDPWGNSLAPAGWGMGTLIARAGWTQRKMAPASPGFPEFRKIITDQMVELARIGADGLHIDKLCWSLGVPDFNPGHGRSPDLPLAEDLLTGVQEVLTACRAMNPDFCLSGEIYWDRISQYTDVCWWAPTDPDHVSPFKFTFPEYMPFIGVEQPLSYQLVNSALLFGYGLLVGPGNYTRSMKDEAWRSLAQYIKEIIRIGEDLKETIFLGRFLDTLQVEVDASNDVKYRVHQDVKTGKRACVLVNFSDKIESATVYFEESKGRTAFLYQPFKKTEKIELSAKLSIPPERPAVVVEH